MEQISLSTSIFGRQLDLPFGVAPVAMQKLLHPEGEVLTAREAFKQNCIFGVSIFSTRKLSEIMEVNSTGMKIHQFSKIEGKDIDKLITAIEELGFTAVTMSVDVQTYGKRRFEERSNFKPAAKLEIVDELGLNLIYRSKKFVSKVYEFTW